MTDTVIDTSALAALIFHEPEGREILQQCRGVRLFAPTLLEFEMANVCAIKQRRNPDYADLIARQFAAFLQAEVKLEPVDIGAVVSLANRVRLTVYDAAYLWLASHHGRALLTLDKALSSASTSVLHGPDPF